MGLRSALALVACVLASGCAYTWGVEHVPLINGPGPHSRWLHVAGGPNVYDVDVHFPKSLGATRDVPLVIVLHGYSGTGPGMERRTGLSRIADSAGFIVAYPDGQKNTQGRRSWSAATAGAPDIAMLRALIDSIAAHTPIDRRRIYLAGFSNGGMMTYRAAQLLDRTFAAVGVVAGALTGGPARGTVATDAIAPVPLVAVHGMLDDNVAYEPRDGPGGRLGAPESVRAWAARNGCAPTPAIDTLLGGLAVRTSYANGCRAEAAAVLYATTGGGHGWPNPGTHEAPLATSDIIWRFFSEHRANDSLVAPDRRP